MTDIKVKVVEFDLEKHPDPEVSFLSIAKVRGTGWQCVVKTSDMKNVKYGIYIPIDSEVPTNNTMFSFLDKKNTGKPFKIKTIRLRQALSQGLLLPAPESASLGDDLTDELGVTRWEPTIPKHLAGDMVREPGNFQKYTSIENWKNFPNVFSSNDAVRYTEKLHGCLSYSTPITSSKGNSSKSISSIKVGDEVLGVDKDGNVVPTIVTNIFDNGKTTDWLNITFSKKDSGNGTAVGTVKCTPNHKFWNCNKNDYVEAKDLVAGDKLLSHSLLQQEIVSIENFIPKNPLLHTKYDIETETHNFFANGILVHNSNVRYGLVNEGKIDDLSYLVGSHKTTRNKDGMNLYSEISRKFQIEEKLRSLSKEFNPKQNFIVYGEIYGWNVQDLVYDCDKNQQQFRIFDVLIDHQYQPWSTIEKVADVLSVKTVPVLYRGLFNIETAMKLRDGKTTLGDGSIDKRHVREGLVVTAEPETYHPDVGRKIIKFISDDYLLRKGSTDGH